MSVIAGCGGGDAEEVVDCQPLTDVAVPDGDIGAAEKNPLPLDRGNMVPAGDAMLMQMQILQFLRWEVQDLDLWGDGGHEGRFNGGVMNYTGCLAEDHTGVVRLQITRFNFGSVGVQRNIEVDGTAVLVFHGKNDYTFIPENLSFDNGRHVAAVKGEARIHIGSLATSNLSFAFGSETWNARALEMDEIPSVESGTVFSFTGRIEQVDGGYLDVTTQEPIEGTFRLEGGFFRLAGANQAEAAVDLRDLFVGAAILDEGGDGIEEAAGRLATTAVERVWAENSSRGETVAFAYAPTISKSRGQATPAVLPGERVELSAALSLIDPETASYQWELWQRPLFSKATLVHPTAVRPYFVADAPGNYIFALHVTSKGQTSTDLMNVNVASWWHEGVGPTSDAGAGPDTDAEVGSLVRVDPLIDSYHSTHGGWHLQTPLGSNTVVNGDHDASYQEFVPDKQGIYFLDGGLHISVGVAREYFAPFRSRHLLKDVVDLDGDGLEDRIYIEDSRFVGEDELIDVLAVYSAEPNTPYLLKEIDPWQTLPVLTDLDGDGRKEIAEQKQLDADTVVLQVAFPAAHRGSYKTPAETAGFDFDSSCGFIFHEIRLPDGQPLLYTRPRYYDVSWCPSSDHHAWSWDGDSLEPYAGTLSIESFTEDFVHLDFNGDGWTDIASLERRFGSSITLWQGQPDNTYVEAGTLTEPNQNELAAGDVNGDGKDELLVTSHGSPDPAEYPRAELFYDLDTAGFTGRTTLYRGPSGSGLYASALRDINDDGRKDFVVLNGGTSYGGDHVAFAIQRADGTFEPPYTMPIYRVPYTLTTLRWFDVNCDGEDDLIVGDRLVMFARPVD